MTTWLYALGIAVVLSLIGFVVATLVDFAVRMEREEGD